MTHTIKTDCTEKHLPLAPSPDGNRQPHRHAGHGDCASAAAIEARAGGAGRTACACSTAVDAGSPSQSGCSEHGDAHDQDHDHGQLASWPRVGGALLLGLAAELSHQLLPGWPGAEVASMALAGAAIMLAGLGVVGGGFKALLRGQWNIGALMAVAVTGAFLIGQWAEAAMVMALFVAAEKLEDGAMQRARNAVRDLMVKTPAAVERLLADGRSQTVQTVAVDQVATGDVLRIKPGERIALDGVVQRGSGSVNQAPITGESTPVDKREGDTVYAGSINTTGVLEVQVTGTAGHTLLDRIVRMVEESEREKAPIQRTVDRFAAIYTPIVMLLAVLVVVGLPLLAGWGWMEALYRALALLVIACPCALVIATPVAIVSALGNAAQHGVLFKGGQALEQAYRVRSIAFDKTGTLTQGRPRLAEWEAAVGAGITREQANAWAHALASRSNHPVSRAIGQGLASGAGDAVLLAEVHEAPGSGVEATLGEGLRLRLGSLHWLSSVGVEPLDATLAATAARWRAQGCAVTALAAEQHVVALFAVTDTIRNEASQVVQALSERGMHTAMLSGDGAEAAAHIAARVGIADAQGGLLPQDKLSAIQALQARHGATAMVGDGINDAPALAQASLGVAMGGPESTDVAAETADVVLMQGNLSGLPGVFRIAQQTHGIVWQNIVLALAGKAVFLILAVLGMATMWMAVVADLGISLLVVANGMRLRRIRAFESVDAEAARSLSPHPQATP